MGTGGMREETAFGTLLMLDQLRGIDSTGVCVVNGDKSVNVLKDTCLPPKILCSEPYRALLRKQVRLLLGHNRAATQGKVTKGNAHPFIKGNIIGVHNGTLDDLGKMDKANKFGTDSEAIFYNIDKHGIEDVWGNRLSGAASLVWYDQVDQTLHFLRNARRPLWFTYTEDNKGLFWASEIWMLKIALGKNNIKHHKIFSPEPHHHFMFEQTGFKDIEEVWEELKPYSPPIIGGSYPLAREYATPELYRVAIIKYNREHPGLTPHHNTHVSFEKLKKEWAIAKGDAGPFRDPSTQRELNTDTPLLTGKRNGFGTSTDKDDSQQSTDLDNGLPSQVLATPAARAALERRDERQRHRRRVRGIRSWRGTSRSRQLALDGESPINVMTEKQFKKKYKQCTFCRESLAQEYDTAIIIDDHHASCNSCALVAETEGVNLTQGAKG